MPEPNLPPLHIHVNSSLENKYNLVDAVFLKTQIPEMPQKTRDKLVDEYGVHKALVIVLVVSLKKIFIFQILQTYEIIIFCRMNQYCYNYFFILLKIMRNGHLKLLLN